MDDLLAKLLKNINAENKVRMETGADSPFPSVEEKTMDYIPFDTGMKLPYLPFSFTSTCAFCGTTDITIDKKRTIPISFLAKFIKECCCQTPFVFNVLYQMCHYPNLEMDEAAKWMAMHAEKGHIPDHLRGRISLCPLCMPAIRERAKVRPGVVGHEIESIVWEQKWNGIKATDEAFKASMDPLYDDWVIESKNRIIAPNDDQDKNKYKKEPGRKVRRPLKFMLLIDILFHMVHIPRKTYTPEYRMMRRAIRTMLQGKTI